MKNKCEICGAIFDKCISPSHLKRVHNISWGEYKEKYDPSLEWDNGLKGGVPWNKGMTLSGDPKYKNMWTKNPHSEETKKKIKESKKKWFQEHPEARMGVVANRIKHMETHPDFYKERTEKRRLEGTDKPMLGKHHSAETRALKSKQTKAYMDAHPDVAKERIRRMKEVYPSSKHSKVLKKLYKNPEFHDKIMAAQMHSRKMSSYEQIKLASEEEIRECNLPKGLMMAVIDHKENNLDPKEPCGVKLILGNGNDMIVESLRILPAGTLPMTECDNRYRNAHLYLFNDKINKWQKAIGEEDEDGRFRLLVSFK